MNRERVREASETLPPIGQASRGLSPADTAELKAMQQKAIDYELRRSSVALAAEFYRDRSVEHGLIVKAAEDIYNFLKGTN